jgi:mono/diheme cytochrome c family protein
MRALASVLLMAVALALAACGGDGDGEEGAATGTTGQGAVSGRAVFTSSGCGNCHTLQAAGTTGMVGPNLDERLASDAEEEGEPLAEFTRESIVDPGAFVAEGFSDGVMPTGIGDQLSDQELDALVGFLVQSVGG